MELELRFIWKVFEIFSFLWFIIAVPAIALGVFIRSSENYLPLILSLLSSIILIVLYLYPTCEKRR